MYNLMSRPPICLLSAKNVWTHMKLVARADSALAGASVIRRESTSPALSNGITSSAMAAQKKKLH